MTLFLTAQGRERSQNPTRHTHLAVYALGVTRRMAEGQIRLSLRWAKDVRVGNFRVSAKLGAQTLEASFTTQNKTTAFSVGEVGGVIGDTIEPLKSLVGQSIELSVFVDEVKEPVGTTRISLDDGVARAAIICEVTLDAKECAAKPDKGGSSWFSFRGKKEKTDAAAAAAAGEGKIDDMPEPKTRSGPALGFQVLFVGRAFQLPPPTVAKRIEAGSPSPRPPATPPACSRSSTRWAVTQATLRAR